ncbi:nucleoporin NUP35-like isoform X2 [Patiria miniata]|uniref:Nucleoporin NUP35 n=1 Tax=Patiria miniata TaxID=46514 RepID=A0A913ZNP3_PATMI|nr:nucleoporin NUP35-like isoform X2 [Patiria miniata]
MEYHSPSLSHSMSQSYGHASSLEPMTLGSPTSMGSSHQVPGSHSNLFLPGYLMGEMGPSVSPSSSRLWSSSRSSPPRGVTPSTLGPRDGGSGLGRSDSRMSQRPAVTRTPKDKTGAPPVAGLFDNVDALKGSPAVGGVYGETPEKRQLDLSMSKTPLPTSSYAAGTPANSRMFSPAQTPQSQFGARQTPSSPAQIDPFYTQGEAITPDVQLDETWITIFGFPPAATSYVLQQFSQYGSIVRHVAASSGNWLHMQYSSKLQAKKALSKNGKVFGGNIMVGVMPCIDKSVMEGGDQCNASTLQSNTPSRYPMTPQAEEVEASQRPTSSIRPLTAAYKAASSNHEVIQGGSTPKKSSNVVSKTLEYMFGW